MVPEFTLKNRTYQVKPIHVTLTQEVREVVRALGKSTRMSQSDIVSQMVEFAIAHMSTTEDKQVHGER